MSVHDVVKKADRRVLDELDANIIPFPSGPLELRRNRAEAALDTLPVRVGHGDACHHERSEVNEAARTVICRDCGVALDPIVVLARLAHNRERLVREGRLLRATVEELHQTLTELRR